MTSILAWLGGGLGVIFFLLIGIVQAIVGYLGIEYHLGAGWAVGCLIASFIFRITFPLTIGTFFGALDVLGWPWWGAALFTAPGLIFMVPGAVGMALVGLGSLFKGKPSPQYTSDYPYQTEDGPKNVTPDEALSTEIPYAPKILKKKKKIVKKKKKIVKKKKKNKNK